MYRRNHTHLQEESYPFTGGIIPIYRRNHTHLQGSPSPLISIYRKHLSVCNLKVIGKFTLSAERIMPVYRRNHTHLQGNHTRLQDVEITIRKTKSFRVIPVYRRKPASIIPVMD
jgi:hypothetical protein